MKTFGKIGLPKIILMIVIFTLCLIIFAEIRTSAQTPDNSRETEMRIAPTL
ncbi:hypothetical protein D1BOALGB6SA_4945 [Olavius sp. associated proteobacterium Delta 1]|nr:hypothetical protein D1BOALGB6SA_4945 [Olavius sp. associated proteobacterium Delta 1]